MSRTAERIRAREKQPEPEPPVTKKKKPAPTGHPFTHEQHTELPPEPEMVEIPES